MELARVPVVGWAAATLMVGAATTGCGHHATSPWDRPPSSPETSSSSSSTTSSTSPAATTSSPPTQPTDYSSLLIKASDIGADFNAPQPPVLLPNNTAGVAQLFANADNSRRIGITIMIVADPASAAVGVENTKANYAGKVTGAWQPIDVGSNGAMISGSAPDNSQAVTVLLFTEGRALANLEFDSAPNDPIDPGVATDVGRKQDAAIKSGLPS
ncbi:MAG TPA: hypothetical protein VGI68_25235 [Mycobacterium sp.]